MKPQPSLQGPTDKLDAGPRSHASDLALVEAVRRGDERARAELAQRLRVVARVLDARNRQLGSPLRDHELEDIVQDAVTRTWESLAQYRGASSLESWVYPIAVRTLSNALRDRRTRGSWLPHDSGVDPDQLLAQQEEFAGDCEALARALGELEPRRADVIRLRHAHDASFDEIGARLGVPSETAKTWYYRGIAALRDLIGRRATAGG